MGNEHLSQDDIDALLAGSGQDDSSDTDGDQELSPEEYQSELADNPRSTVQPLNYQPLRESSVDNAPHNIDLILDVGVEVTVELGRKRMLIKDILSVGPGSIIELNKLAGEPVDLLVNNKLMARGEVVVINENFGVRIIDIVVPEQRIRNLK